MMRGASVLLLSAALAALLAFPGCGGGGGNGNGGGVATVQGTLRDDASLQPVGGAVVTSGADSTTSGGNWQFALQTTSGNRTITITANGYQRTVLNESLSEGVNNLGTRYLGPQLNAGRGAAGGTVRRGGATEAAATLRSGNAQALSKADGRYTIYNLETGQRAITALSGDGQTTGSAPANIQSGATRSGVDIDLGLAPPPPPVL